ncbi:MFS transporter [Cupriavidus sp. YAF13]|uniref:MFS transporter n=1 Tax=Cupriavidus sp. YAF13 TaxID=3233075 RepID=UPI003F8EC0A7
MSQELSGAALAEPAGGPWSPLRNKVFRAVWLATLVSNIGTWMHDVGAGWMMTSVSPSPLMVALVQAATTLPMFLFALPSGVLADIVDRRKYLLFAQAWMLVVATALGLLALAGLVTPAVLLVATFLLGTGAAMSAPPFQAIVPDLVPKPELQSAVALNSLGVNISRAIGPALGGVVLTLFGPPAVFLLNAVSVVGVLWVIYQWQPAQAARRLPPEHFFQAVRAGLRYVQAAPVLQVVLVRAVAFFAFGSAGWALLPLVARRELAVGPGGYGLLLACVGAGAIGGALMLPRLRKLLSPDWLVLGASVIFALALFAMSGIKRFALIAIVLLFAGLAWIVVLSVLNGGAQRSAAGWVKARALAVYLLVFFGSMAAGSAVWGQVASLKGTAPALQVAGAGMLLFAALAMRWRLADSPDLDLTPSPHLAGAPVLDETAGDRGPVMISVEYYVDKANAAAFHAAARELRRVRRRGGALSWNLFEDMDEPGRYVETFVIESWLEHLRQHERFSVNDKAIQARVHALHLGPAAPRVRHFVSPL